tara:strand:- start:291 stop:2141 length:1851 start_codon:yes stop_codon:yes gene_type:complete
MAVNLDTFQSTSVGLDQENFGKVPDSQFDTAMATKMQEDITKSLTPEDVKPSDANKVDVQLQGNIAVNLKKKDLFTGDLTSFEDEDSKTAVDKVDALFKSSSPFTTDTSAFNNLGRGTGPVEAGMQPVGVSGKTVEEELADEEMGEPGQPVGEFDFQEIIDPAKEYAIKGYQSIRDYFNPQQYAGPQGVGSVGYGAGTTGSYGGLSGTLTGGSAGSTQGFSGTGYGSLQNTSVQNTQSAVAALGPQAPQFANQAMLGQVSGGGYGGLSSSTAAGASQLATSGAGVNALGQPMYGSTAASSSRSIFGTAASIYGIYDGIKNKDYFSAGTSLITLLNPATAVPVAIMHAAKMLFGAWSASKRQKPKFGGAEFKATKNSLMATGGYGYNGYQPAAGQATVASVADYVNTYTKTFGLNFNGSKWADAIAADPRLNRYDTMNDSGYADPSVLSRKIFETKGLITGNPTYNGQAITSQEDYQKKVAEFNDYYKKTALERGGLVDAKRVGIDTPLSNEYKQITFKHSKQVGGGGSGPQYTTRTTGGGRGGGGGTTQTGYWDMTNSWNGGQVWVPAAPNVQVEQGYQGSSAYAISYSYEDATPHDMLYRNLVGSFQRGQGGTNY